MAEISVIVPVYRAERYLPACLDSLLSQSFTDFELILVDDGSPDRCGEICEEYACRDSRITVLHQENRGQSAARNRALKMAKAPWICFVDSDDLIHPQTLELLYRAAQNADVSMCRMLEAPELPADFFADKTGDFTVDTLDDGTLARMYEEGTYPAWVSCGKLIRLEAVKQHLFCPGRVYEDNEAVCHWLAGQRLAQIPEDLYFYRTNLESTTKSGFSMKKLDFLWALENITKFYGSIGFSQTESRFFDRYVQETAGFYRIVKNDEQRNDVAAAIQKSFRRFVRAQGVRLSKSQFESVLDAMHPNLIKVYWPVEGIVRTIRREGVGGIVRKLGNHLKRGD